MPALVSCRSSASSRTRSLPQATAAGQVVEDLDETAAVVAVVALPAVGADAEDLAAVALGYEAELVGDEVAGLRRPCST